MRVHHTSVGYLIVEQLTAELLRSRDVPYHGLDRLPQFEPADQNVRAYWRLEPLEDTALANAIEEFSDKLWSGCVFFARHEEASTSLNSLKRAGMSLEILFCELAWSDNEVSRLNSYPASVDPPACTSMRCLGYDVSWPGANHSAILQPGVIDKSIPWKQKLNEWGLLNFYSQAAEIREEYLRIYPNPPFDIFRTFQFLG